MLGNTGPRNGHNLVLPQHPCQSHLGWSGVMSRRYFLKYGMAQHSALLNRRISHHRYVAVDTPRQQIVFDTAADEVVEHLVGCYLTPTGEIDKVLHLVNIKVADAPITILYLIHNCLKSRHRLLHGNDLD